MVSVAGSESFDSLDGVYGSPEEFLEFLESHSCECDFCARRVAWLRGQLEAGVDVKPPYLDDSLFNV